MVKCNIEFNVTASVLIAIAFFIATLVINWKILRMENSIRFLSQTGKDMSCMLRPVENMYTALRFWLLIPVKSEFNLKVWHRLCNSRNHFGDSTGNACRQWQFRLPAPTVRHHTCNAFQLLVTVQPITESALCVRVYVTQLLHVIITSTFAMASVSSSADPTA
jgi:hypothetical protein